MADFNAVRVSGVAATNTTDDGVTILSLDFDLETRPKSGSDTDEEFRWVARAVLMAQYKSMSATDQVGSDWVDAPRLEGSFQGGPDVAIELSNNWGNGAGELAVTHDGFRGADAPGGAVVVREIHLMSTTAWGDSPFNP